MRGDVTTSRPDIENLEIAYQVDIEGMAENRGDLFRLNSPLTMWAL
jgi:hypothetical protein